MSEKIKAIRGNEKRCEDVVTWLEEHGARDAKFQIEGSCENKMYFVDPNGDAQCVDEKFKYLFDVEEMPRWRAVLYKTYWYIDDEMKIYEDNDCRGEVTNNRYENGNYFRTESEAEEMRDKIVELLKERK